MNDPLARLRVLDAVFDGRLTADVVKRATETEDVQGHARETIRAAALALFTVCLAWHWQSRLLALLATALVGFAVGYVHSWRIARREHLDAVAKVRAVMEAP